MQADTTSWPTDSELNWTPRQLEVIKLIAKGMTNAQIADRLDISLAGAKWHVSEILSKLGVESREAIPEYWHSRTSPITRLRRRFAVGIGLPSAKVALGTTAVGGLGLLGAGVFMLSDSPAASNEAEQQAIQSEEDRAVEAAREYLADLAQVTRFSFEKLEPHQLSEFGLGSIRPVIANGQLAYEVLLVAPPGIVRVATDGLRFSATVHASDGTLVERSFAKIPAPRNSPGLRDQILGPYYIAFQIPDASGGMQEILIAPGSGGWSIGYTTSHGELQSIAMLGTAYGEEPPIEMTVSVSQEFSQGRVPGDVETVRVTLQDGRELEAVMGTPPSGVGPGGKLFALATDGVWPVLFEALAGDGKVVHRYVTGPIPQNRADLPATSRP